MAVDNTHTKYLHGADKKAWTNYKEAYEAQAKFDNFIKGFDKVEDGGGHGRQDLPLGNAKNRKKGKNKK